MPMRYCVRSGRIKKPTPKIQKERRTFSPLFLYKIGYLFSLSASVGLMPYTFLK